MGDSLWKKEITFGRKAKQATEPAESPAPVEPAAPKQSFWKKEIGGKSKRAQEPVAAEPAAPKESIWKKEIGRKPKEPVERAVAAQPAESVLKKDLFGGRTQKEPKQSFWKKEIGRKAKEPAAPVAPAQPKDSLLKREISFSRKKRDREVERLAQEAAQAVSPAFEPAAAEPVEAAAVPPPTALAEAAVAAMPDPEAAPAPAPEPVEPSLPAPAAAAEPEIAAPEPEPPAVPFEPAFAVPSVPEGPLEPAAAVPTLPLEPEIAEPFEPAAAVPTAPLEPELPQPFEPAAAVPPAPPLAAVPDLEPSPEPAPLAAVPDPEPVGADLHAVPMLPVDDAPTPVVPAAVAPPPAPPAAPALPPSAPVAAEPPPLPDLLAPAPVLESAPVEDWMEPETAAPQREPWLAAPEVPPAPVLEPVAPPVVVHPPVPAAALPPLPEQPVPFYKRDLSFSRKAKEPKQPKAAKEPKSAATPFWKRDLSLSRRPKPAAPELPAAPAAAVEAPEARQPFWKKQLSFSRGSKAAAVPAAPKAAAAPFWKRGLSLPKPSLPSKPAARGGGGHKVQRFVGLKIGASQLAAARVANNGAIELLQLAREPLEPGIVVGGELREPEALGDALKKFFAKNNLPKRNVRLGIASNRIGVRIFDVTGIEDEKQLENAIHFRAQEALPIPLDEAVLDYHVVSETVDDEGNSTRRVLLVVAYRELVERYVSACKKAGISLSGIDLEAFALLRALSAPRPEDQPSDAALVAVSIGHDRSTFAVSDGRVCEFTRVLEWGGATLSVGIARALNLAPSEVEAIKRSVSLESPDVPQGVAPEQYALAVDAARKQIQSFARELVSSLQFYQNQPGSLGIGEIVITGGTASLAGLAEELQRLIGVRVRVGDPLARLKIAKKVAVTEPVGSLAVAIGLGIED